MTADPTPHTVSLVVWDVLTPMVVGQPATLKVGVKCSAACVLAGEPVLVCDARGTVIGRGALGATPWPGTAALFWAELAVTAPASAGPCSGSVTFATHESPHEATSVPIPFLVVRAPECAAVLTIADRQTGSRLRDVELRLGPYRACTDEQGQAQFDVPAGSYDFTAWKPGYEIETRTLAVTDDLSLQVALAPEPVLETSYWM